MSNNLVSQYGTLAAFGWLWRQPVWLVFCAGVVIDFGIINGLMKFENRRGKPPAKRRWFMTFALNDTIVIPLWLTLGAYLMGRNPHPRGWPTATWWHLLVLVASFLASLVLEVSAVRGGYFSKGQEVSPSKFWHTLIFGVMGYYMFTSLAAGLASNVNWGWNIALIAIVAAWVAVIVWDNRLFGSEPPAYVHPEWSWRSWRPNWERG